MRGRGLSRAGGDCQANFGAAQRKGRCLIVKISGALAQCFLGPGLCLLCALDVNVFSALGGSGQDGHLVRQNFGESPSDREMLHRAPRPIADLTNLQLGNEGGMSRQNTELPVLAGYLNLVGVLADKKPIGEISYRTGGTMQHLAVAWGFAEVLPDKVTILAAAAERAEDIDIKRAQEAKARAEEALRQGAADLDYEATPLALRRAEVRLAVATRAGQTTAAH